MSARSLAPGSHVNVKRAVVYQTDRIMPQAASQTPGIFICYRRDDTAGHAGRLYDRLTSHFGDGHVFMDIDLIEPGEDFVQIVENAIGSCEILLALIGRNWLTSQDKAGRRRDGPSDFVRLEIAAALARGVRVIPVLVQGARMPAPGELPDELSSLSQRNAFELSDLRWKHDVERLVATLEKNVDERRKSPPARRRRWPPPAALSVLIVSLLVAGAAVPFVYLYRGWDEPAVGAPTNPVANAAPALSATPDAVGSMAVEVAFWNSVNGTDRQELEAYLKKYPAGEFKDLANIRLARLGETVLFNSAESSNRAPTADERDRLDKFAAALREVPTAQGYIMAYGGRRGVPNEAQISADRAREYLVNSRGIDASRVVTVDAGFREKAAAEFWIVPSGATPPMSSPTVDPGDVRFAEPDSRPQR